MQRFDVAIIGAGIAGYMAAYEIAKETKLSIALIEQGNSIENRKCPMILKKTKCLNCKECSIIKGFGGAGNFLDGKYNITTEFGGWLTDYIPDQDVLKLINYVDSINVGFGATTRTFSTTTSAAKEIKKNALHYDIHLQQANIKHFGIEKNFEFLKRMYKLLSSRAYNDKISVLCNTKVNEIIIGDEYSLKLDNDSIINCKYLIAAPGRSGAEWLANECRKLDIPLINNQVDIGVRVELPAEVLEEITDSVYEAKLKYRTKKYGDIVRTFDMNPYGYVVTENVDGLLTVNGHSYASDVLRSKNTNFAILISSKFTEPFNNPNQYGKTVASLSNLLGNGVLVQRFGDLISGRRTTHHRLSQSFTKPTLETAEPGDLSLVLPKRHLDDIIEMIYALGKLVPGVANDDTLLYGVEVKIYGSRLKLSNCLETRYKNFFAIGDGAGVTCGLSQAGASGVLVAKEIINRVKE